MAVGTIKLSVKPYIDRAKLSDITLTDEEIGRYIKAALRSSCMLIRDYAKTHHNYRDHSGKLTQGIKYEVYHGTRSKNKDNWYGSVGYIRNDARPEYAKWQLYGTGQYGVHKTDVVPRRAPFLHFMGINPPFTGRWFRLKSARGIKGEDYIKNAYVKNKAKIDAIFEDALQTMLATKK